VCRCLHGLARIPDERITGIVPFSWQNHSQLDGNLKLCYSASYSIRNFKSGVPQRRIPGRVLSCLLDCRLNTTLELCADAVYICSPSLKPSVAPDKLQQIIAFRFSNSGSISGIQASDFTYEAATYSERWKIGCRTLPQRLTTKCKAIPIQSWTGL